MVNLHWVVVIFNLEVWSLSEKLMQMFFYIQTCAEIRTINMFFFINLFHHGKEPSSACDMITELFLSCYCHWYPIEKCKSEIIKWKKIYAILINNAGLSTSLSTIHTYLQLPLHFCEGRVIVDRAFLIKQLSPKRQPQLFQ